MSTSTTNFNLTKDGKTDYYNIATTNANLDAIDAALGNTAKFEKAGGTATAITLTGIILSNGCSKSFIVSNNNNSATTTVNGKQLYKPRTTTAPKLSAGEAATIWYDSSGDCFFLNAKDTATGSIDGLMSSTDKSKLDGVEDRANNYIHPANHTPAIIAQDANNRFVTDNEKATWNSKQNNLGYTPVQQGTGVGQLSNMVKIGWNGNRLRATVDSMDLGNFAFGDIPSSLPANGGNADTVDGYHVDLGTNNTYGLRPIAMSTFDLNPGSTPMNNGQIYIMYE